MSLAQEMDVVPCKDAQGAGLRSGLVVVHLPEADHLCLLVRRMERAGVGGRDGGQERSNLPEVEA